MSERPILFSGPMVRAILDGSKTQTRRVVKPQPFTKILAEGERYVTEDEYRINAREGRFRCPYGAPGDRLWVRETWAAEDALDDLAPRNIPPGGPIWYAADNSLRGLRGILHMGKNRPGMFMPRFASRLTLEVVSVRVERLNEISEADAEAEGIERYRGPLRWMRWRDPITSEWNRPSATGAFRDLWDSINAKRAPWESNPWVWVIEFKKAPQP